MLQEFTYDQLTDIAAVMREGIASQIMPFWGQLKPGDIRDKTSPADPATVADWKSETFLSRRLPQLWHGAATMGEEEVSDDPAALEKLDLNEVIIIDGLDGTTEFIAGKPFGTLTTFARKGEGILSAIALVDRAASPTDFNIRIIIAAKGQGAWNSPSEDMPLTRMVPFAERGTMPGHDIGFIKQRYFTSDYPFRDDFAARKAAQQTAFHWVEASNGATFFTQLADGQAIASVNAPSAPWDISSVVMRELGAVVRHLDGIEYRPNRLNRGCIIAASEDVYRRVMQDTFKPIGLLHEIDPCVPAYRVPAEKPVAATLGGSGPPHAKPKVFGF